MEHLYKSSIRYQKVHQAIKVCPFLDQSKNHEGNSDHYWPCLQSLVTCILIKCEVVYNQGDQLNHYKKEVLNFVGEVNWHVKEVGVFMIFGDAKINIGTVSWLVSSFNQTNATEMWIIDLSQLIPVLILDFIDHVLSKRGVKFVHFKVGIVVSLRNIVIIK